MLDALKNLLTGGNRDSAVTPALPEQEDQLLASAAAMLLFEVAWADHDMGDDEVELIKHSLGALFELSAENTQWIVNDARERHETSVGLYEYTRTINDALDVSEKFELVVALWRLAYSDEKLEALEEHAIRRISELLYLPHNQFIRAKLTAKEQQPDSL